MKLEVMNREVDLDGIYFSVKFVNGYINNIVQFLK